MIPEYSTSFQKCFRFWHQSCFIQSQILLIEVQMLSRHNLLLLIPAILLIPILFGMIPLNMAHKLASGGPLSHCRQAQWSNHCPFHSIASHNDPTIVNLNSASLDQESTPTYDIAVLDPGSIHSNIIFNSVPLRC